MFPDSMKAFHTPNLDILGAPIGDYIHCTKFIASKSVEALKLLSRLHDVAVIDPQVAFTLLRVCGSFCRLAHIPRSTPPSLSFHPLRIFHMAVKESFATYSAVPTACFRCWSSTSAKLEKLIEAMYTAQECRAKERNPKPPYLRPSCACCQACSVRSKAFNGLVVTQDTILIGSNVDSPIPQKALSFKIDTEQFRALISC